MSIVEVYFIKEPDPRGHSPLVLDVVSPIEYKESYVLLSTFYMMYVIPYSNIATITQRKPHAD